MVVLVLLVLGLAGGYLLRGEGNLDGSEFIKGIPASGAQVAATLERHGDRARCTSIRSRVCRDKVYQAWVQRDDKMEPSTTFVVDREGGAKESCRGQPRRGQASR